MRWHAKSKQCLVVLLLCGIVLAACKHETVAITPYPDNDDVYSYTGSYEPQAYAPPPQPITRAPRPVARTDSYSYGMDGDDNDSGYYYGYHTEQQAYAPPPPAPKTPAPQLPPEAYPDYDSQYYYGATTDAAEHHPYVAPPPQEQNPPQQQAAQPNRRMLRPYDYNTDEDGNVTRRDNDSAYYPLYYYE